MKHLIIFAALSLTASLTQSQSMRLIPFTPAMYGNSCVPVNNKKHICYALEYTPASSGILTSYTTAFFVSCTSGGPAVVKNQSCWMTNNVSMINGCGINGTVLVNSSGHSGGAPQNVISEGVPVILHQLCFSIPPGESVTVREDPVTDLTTSIDLNNEDSKTEYPTFAETVIRKDRPAVSRPVWLDFKTVNAGDFVAQLDWTTSAEVNKGYFVVERSTDGVDFTSIGRVEALSDSGRVNSYQFLDKQAMVGKNFYRLQQIDLEGNVKHSPVRALIFSEIPFTVKVTPNPADTYILVEIQSPIPETTIKLMDANGRLVIDEKNNNRNLKSRLNVEKLNAGLYTVVVECGEETFSENIMITH